MLYSSKKFTDALDAGRHPLAMALIIKTSGSTPQKEGSLMLVAKEGIITGTIGGGILEESIKQLSQELMNSGNSGIYHFNFDHDTIRDEDAICGGQASVLIDAEPLKNISVYKQLKNSLDNRIPGVLITTIEYREEVKAEIKKFWSSGKEAFNIPDPRAGEADLIIKKLLSKGRSGSTAVMEFYLPEKDKEIIIFFEVIFPLPKLVIAGAGHIGKALAPIAATLDFEVTVVDDRPEFANPDNIPEADHFLVADVGEAMKGLIKTPDTYVVIVTRGHKDDEKALRPCIGNNLAYVGMIGSRNKVMLMHRNFIQNNWASEEQWQSIYAPVGLAIKSQTVGEIAVSIAAQLIQVRNSKKSNLSL